MNNTTQAQSFEEFREFAESAIDAWTADGWDPDVVQSQLRAAYQRYLNAARISDLSHNRQRYHDDYGDDRDYSTGA